MRLTEAQTKAFQGLQQTETGKVLATAFRDLVADLCDIRSMQDVTEADRKALVRLSALIESEIISRLTLGNPRKDVGNYE